MQSDLGLNIREAHAFNTSDSFSLDVFVVDQWTAPVSGGIARISLSYIAACRAEAILISTTTAESRSILSAFFFIHAAWRQLGRAVRAAPSSNATPSTTAGGLRAGSFRQLPAIHPCTAHPQYCIRNQHTRPTDTRGVTTKLCYTTAGIVRASAGFPSHR